jgi:hypothetical protein
MILGAIRGALRRSPAPVSRAMLDVDAGALGSPTSYPYPPGLRPVRPFLGRLLLPGRERSRAQLYPPIGNPTQRSFAHVAGRTGTNAKAATRDSAGIRSDAKIVRTRPWLFAGTSSATDSDKAAVPSMGAPASAYAGPCEGCG